MRRTVTLGLAAAAASWASAEEWRFGSGSPDPWRIMNARVLGAGRPGLRLQAVNSDPQMVLNLPGTYRLAEGGTVEVEMSATAGQVLQLFWGGSFSERDSVAVQLVADGRRHKYRLVIPGDAMVSNLRVDPTNASGEVFVERISVTFANFFAVPRGPYARRATKRAELRSGRVRLEIDTTRWQTFDVYVRDAGGRERLAATSVPRDPVVLAGGTRLDLAKARASWSAARSSLSAQLVDGDGVRWRLQQTFDVEGADGCIRVRTSVAANAARSVARFPVVGLFAGNGSFGGRKSQGLFAGVEYLVDEPSSNELDVRGANANRLVPDPVKITFPLMAIQANGIYVGLTWPEPGALAALFDSPGRVIEGHGHAMLLSLPAVGKGMGENRLLADQPFRLEPGKPLVAEATIVGGAGNDATEAIRHYCALNPAPAAPARPRDNADQIVLFVDAYTRSEAYGDGLWRHAAGAGFRPAPAADACAFLRWLAGQSRDARVKARAEEAIAKGLAKIPADAGYLEHAVSHIVPPVAPLVFGRLRTSFRRARRSIDETVRQMHPDGTFVFDHELAKTHFEKQAVGYAADKVMRILATARLLGDDELLKIGLKGLDALVRFDGRVPRGAQTWEIPLHTPDIMAAGRAAEAFVMGYELTGARRYLERAVYWAWTGVPFVYLKHPAAGAPIGLYATTAVLGGTNWGRPFWIGLPVQWCGLTYAYPLFDLARHDPDGPWRAIAEGITVSGMQQQWPERDPARGLFPDFFHIREQRRDGPKINPGAILVNYARLVGRPLCAFAAERKSGAWITAPAKLSNVSGGRGDLKFSAAGAVWRNPYYIVVARFPRPRTVLVGSSRARRVEDVEAAAAPAYEYDAAARRLILKVSGDVDVVVRR